jgi:quinol monooxygenase YgiN
MSFMIPRGLPIALMLFLALATGFAQQPPAAKRVYVVTIIDVIPSPGGLGPVDALLRQFAADSRKESGCSRFEVVRQQGRPNHYIILSLWDSQADFDAHISDGHTRAFREKLQPSLGSPFDERLHESLE